VSRLPPHKMRMASLYRAWFWRLKELEGIVHKTQMDKVNILDATAQLDKIWAALPPEEKRDIDPLIEVTCQAGGRWTEMKVWMCPHCGHMNYVAAGSDPLPRCRVCMLDIDVPLRQQMETP
jgi:hypothetical protein